jgi:transposase
VLPLFEQLKQWLIKSERSVLPKTKLGEAITYCLNQWEKLTVYTTDGRLNIDNNRAERAIKPFVIGRKNWLFSNTAKGANASIVLYSMIETAKANGLTPFNYVMNVLTHISQGDGDVEKLLPWSQEPS